MTNPAHSPNVEMATTLDFLGCELIAAFRRDAANKKTTIVAKQLNAGTSAGITLSELADRLVTGVQSLFPNGDATITPPKIELPDALQKIAANYKAYVNQVMLKIDKGDGEQKASVEYAFWISIGLDQEALEKLKQEAPFNILMVKEVYLKIWNTDNEAILKEMQFLDTNAILGAPALPEPTKKSQK